MKAMDCLSINIKNRRKSLGYNSARAFAEAIDMATVTIAKAEAKLSFPAAETLTKIAAGLKCSESDLFANPNEKREIPKKVSVENQSLEDAALILDKIQDTQPLYRSVILAMLFRDDTLVLPTAPAALIAQLRTFRKAL